ncbi:hypothetical protein B0H16DRAFT_1477721 [Mycena metata]|uniref:Uncharacterized protein n=1 Tax=Mycena metata TaxID=1033252 RepID=A0AAD7H9C7_9AGAR|nr:hypothetical protein B0H16DRAFT_1477721 [Mycena metata]
MPRQIRVLCLPASQLSAMSFPTEYTPAECAGCCGIAVGRQREDGGRKRIPVESKNSQDSRWRAHRMETPYTTQELVLQLQQGWEHTKTTVVSRALTLTVDGKKVEQPPTLAVAMSVGEESASTVLHGSARCCTVPHATVHGAVASTCTTVSRPMTWEVVPVPQSRYSSNTNILVITTYTFNATFEWFGTVLRYPSLPPGHANTATTVARHGTARHGEIPGPESNGDISPSLQLPDLEDSVERERRDDERKKRTTQSSNEGAGKDSKCMRCTPRRGARTETAELCATLADSEMVETALCQLSAKKH